MLSSDAQINQYDFLFLNHILNFGTDTKRLNDERSIVSIVLLIIYLCHLLFGFMLKMGGKME
jgi:hypothetical protein